MAAYYNEIDPYAAQWLRNLIAKGHIAAGEVDERSIEDVRPDDLRGFTQCHFFAGIGVWSFALRLAGWPDDRPVWTGSCPCQPFSAAGKGAGFSDERHLWPAWHWLIQQRRPAEIYGEQVSSKDAEPWLDLVFTDLEAGDYSCAASYFPAAGVGAPHIRERTLWMANATRTGRRRRSTLARWASQEPGGSSTDLRASPWPDGFGSGSNERVTDVLSPSYGTPGRVGRMRAYGNSIVAQAAAEFIRAAREAIE
jgi:DNA (cytosine-5)-methyltransferase 1